MKLSNPKTWSNTSVHYGLVSVLFHWLTLALIIPLYLIGDMIEDLDYYDPWYQQAPWWHKSLGICLFFLILLRVAYRLSAQRVRPLPTHSAIERVGAHAVHILLYLVIITICCSGYMVSTSKGAGVEVFSIIEIPAIMTLEEEYASLFAKIHEISINILIVLLSFHVLGALKHHFYDKDSTLKRILGIKT